MDTHSERTQLWSRRFSWVLVAVGGILVLLLIFDAGFVLGSRRSLEMRGPRGEPNFGLAGWGVAIPHGFAPQGHGAVGTIQSISLPNIVITTRDGDDTQTVVITPQTKIESATTSISDQQLHVGQQIVALGEPGTTTQTQLRAVLIRILPPPPIQ